MKYRVKKITRADGKDEFFPQHKHLLFWSDCYEMGTFRIKCDTFQEAEEYIIMWELNKLHKKLEIQRKRVVKCDYIPLGSD